MNKSMDVSEEDLTQKKIVLCFDGTSNSFIGGDADTNVVKLFEMFDRHDKHQYHYYQPGIGTYTPGTKLQNVAYPTIGVRLSATLDEVTASSFAEHVVAGYKFLMRYYMEGDQIYIFGFSRGAYTARFLAEMLDKIGLLSKGNEETLSFLWYQYSEHRCKPDDAAISDKLQSMSDTFCRGKIQPPQPFVYFLGLWDCVNSVARLNNISELSHYANASPNIALHVRHAISCHERRILFHPTLFLNEDQKHGTCEERWFAGNHGNVGGGWDPIDGMLLSDFPLIWMVEELRKQEKIDDLELKISWRSTSDDRVHFKNTFDFRKRQLECNKQRLIRGEIANAARLYNDTLNLRDCGPRLSSTFYLVFWWLMESLPLKHTDLELVGKKATPGRNQYSAVLSSRPNHGRSRRIPFEPNAIIDPSVEFLYKHGVGPGMCVNGAQYRYF